MGDTDQDQEIPILKPGLKKGFESPDVAIATHQHATLLETSEELVSQYFTPPLL